MSDVSAVLTLPYILPSQAQKHVTHNEALARLDVAVQLAVIARDLSAPPASPAQGDRYLVPAGATGAWAGQGGNIAVYDMNTWVFQAPVAGWAARVLSEDALVRFDGTDWLEGVGALRAEVLGLGGAADATNRLTSVAPATLLTHEGAGHQLKINKAAPGDTASLLFQTGWSGRAEMGTAGSDGFAIKVSADGSAWHEVFRTEPDGYARTAVRRLEVDKGGSNQGGIANATPTRLTFGNLVVNPGGFFDAGLSRYTPPAGVLLLNAGVYLTGLSAGGICTLRLTRNGTVIQQVIGYAAAGGDIGLGIDAQDTASGTDYYEVEVYVTTAGTAVANGNPANTFFKAVLL